MVSLSFYALVLIPTDNRTTGAMREQSFLFVHSSRPTTTSEQIETIVLAFPPRHSAPLALNRTEKPFDEYRRGRVLLSCGRTYRLRNNKIYTHMVIQDEQDNWLRVIRNLPSSPIEENAVVFLPSNACMVPGLRFSVIFFVKAYFSAHQTWI